MDEQEWSSTDPGQATRATFGGCVKVAFGVFAAVVVLGFVVSIVLDIF